MIIVLNGYPGVGKLTIGRELAGRLNGKLLDIHSVYNVAFALTEFKSPEFRDTVEKIGLYESRSHFASAFDEHTRNATAVKILEHRRR